jgi:hypothetical protein
MTRLESLRGLYDAVNGGHMPTFPVSFAALGEAAHLADEALDRKSVDAALALFAATLPGWDYQLWNLGTDEAGADLFHPGYGGMVYQVSWNQATALLLACLAALIVIEGGSKGG